LLDIILNLALTQKDQKKVRNFNNGPFQGHQKLKWHTKFRFCLKFFEKKNWDPPSKICIHFFHHNIGMLLLIVSILSVSYLATYYTRIDYYRVSTLNPQIYFHVWIIKKNFRLAFSSILGYQFAVKLLKFQKFRSSIFVVSELRRFRLARPNYPENIDKNKIEKWWFPFSLQFVVWEFY